jgi:hypothetical protein
LIERAIADQHAQELELKEEGENRTAARLVWVESERMGVPGDRRRTQYVSENLTNLTVS